MSYLLSKLFRIDSRERMRLNSRRRERSFGCERLEERITLSATTAAVPTTSFVTLSPNEGGFIAFDVVSRVNFDGNFFLGLDDNGELILSGTVGGNTNGLSGDWRNLDTGQVVNSGTGNLSSGESPFRTIPAPGLNPEPGLTGGTIAIAEIFFPSPSSLSDPAVTERVVSREQMFRAAEIPASSQALPAAQGRDIAFEVAFTQPTRPTAGIAKAAEGLLAPPIVQTTILPQENGLSQADARAVQLAAASTSSVQIESSGQIANDSSPRVEQLEFKVVSFHNDSADSIQSSEPPYLARAVALPSPLHGMTAFDQVFADWHDRRSQVAQLREQEHHFLAWEVVVALAFGGLFVRRQHSPTESQIEQEPPRRKKLANCKNQA